MKRIILLCFIHGFKGGDFTFGDFPTHLRDAVANNLPDAEVLSIVYPKYETRGELTQITEAFLEWLKERVLELRKQHLPNPWPPNDRHVGVVLIAHSMGGFIATDTLFRILDSRPSPTGPIFPLIHGILTFDTPLNGLARSMFVYGAFSNYQKVSSVFNLMTALTAATPAAISRLTSRTAAGRITKPVPTNRSTNNPAWKAWQLIALRTGAAGVVAAGGVLAFQHRRTLLAAARHAKRNGLGGSAAAARGEIARRVRSSMDALGQGLAYLNRGNVGASFAWLGDHFAFVGPLLRPGQLVGRLERLGRVKGVGVRCVYASLGENGVWEGGLFVPERTFCAVPALAAAAEVKAGDEVDRNDESGARRSSRSSSVTIDGVAVNDNGGENDSAARLFVRQVIAGAEDEIAAHVGMFRRERNLEYERMVIDAAGWVVERVNDETDVYEPEPEPKVAETEEAGQAEATSEETVTEMADMDAVASAVDGDGGVGQAEEVILKSEGKVTQGARGDDDVEMMFAGAIVNGDAIPDESPLDIAAAASLVPLPDDADIDIDQASPGEGSAQDEAAERKRAYLEQLMGIAQQTGTRLRSYMPSMPTVAVEMPKISMPAVSLPSMPNLPSVAIPSRVYPFSKTSPVDAASAEESGEGKIESSNVDAGLTNDRRDQE
ncbi:hypothetical protein VTJ49DRAFT_509 [Mycothermus thermophilus]|uniref:DUF676 domain-containing protein n=1 Tax=Humicola insolens TaxID=85995 RepID=A0ABR3VEV3_HUMIN